MVYLLDTCICVALIRGRSAGLRERIERFEIGDLVVSSITEAELRFGAERSREPERNHRQLEQMLLTLPVVDFGREAALRYGGIRAGLEAGGSVIGPLDLLIAAHGLALGLPVVTNNVGEFSRVEGLRVEDWG